MSSWAELADGVFVRAYAAWNLNVGLVLGEESCLLVDTRVSPPQGEELKAHVRAVSSLPATVVNTHWHLDHCLGNAAFSDRPILGHPASIERLQHEADVLLQELRSASDRDAEEELVGAVVLPPTDPVEDVHELDLGSRVVRLRHLGRGHTDGDLVVEVPDAATLFAGDLVRENGSPWYADAYPLEWPTTVDRLAEAGATTVVPGHGTPMDGDQVATQRQLFHDVAESIRQSWASGLHESVAASRIPLSPTGAGHAVRRGYAQLAAEDALRPSASRRA